MLLSCRMCRFLCQLLCEKTGGMRWRRWWWWEDEGCKRQNKWFIWFAGQYIYTFCLRLSYNLILQPPWETHYPPTSCLVTEYWVDFFFLLHSISHLLPLNSFALLLSAATKGEKRHRELSWDSAGWRTEETGIFLLAWLWNCLAVAEEEPPRDPQDLFPCFCAQS